MSELDPRVVQLRAEFDGAFAASPSAGREATTDLLLIGVAGASYAVRVTETLALARDRKIVRVPSTMPGLLGLTGFRGDAIPVYGLAALLDHAAGATPWVAVCGPRQEPVGIAFETLQGYVAATPAQIHPLAQRPNPHLAATVTLDGSARAIVDVPSLLAVIERRFRELRSPKEP